MQAQLFTALTTLNLLFSPLHIGAQATQTTPATPTPNSVYKQDAPSEANLRKRGLIWIDSEGLILTGNAAVAGSGAGCTSLQVPTITNKAALAKVIDAYIKDLAPESPMNGLGNDFVEGSVRANINPLLMVAQARKESIFGQAGIAEIPGLNNAFGRRASNTQPSIEGWYKYPTWAKSLNDATNPDGDHPNYAKTWIIDQLGGDTLDKYLNIYAPPTENNTSQYATDVRKWMQEIADLAGSALSCGTGNSDANGSKIVQIASGEVGNSESSSNCGEMIQKYFDYNNYNGCGQPWCGFFVGWVYGQAGLPIPAPSVPVSGQLAAWFQENKFWFAKSEPYTPKPGDIYIKVDPGLPSDGGPLSADHIGIVESVEGNVLHTIDGNYGDAVSRRNFINWASPDSPIVGFGRYVDKGTVTPDGGGSSSGPSSNGGGSSEF